MNHSSIDEEFGSCFNFHSVIYVFKRSCCVTHLQADNRPSLVKLCEI